MLQLVDLINDRSQYTAILSTFLKCCQCSLNYMRNLSIFTNQKYYTCVIFLFLPTKNIIFPPCDALSFKFPREASEKDINSALFISRRSLNRSLTVFDLAFLRTLFACITSSTVAFLTELLISHASYTRSGFACVAIQLICPAIAFTSHFPNCPIHLTCPDRQVFQLSTVHQYTAVDLW